MITGEFNHKGELVFEIGLIRVKKRNPVSDTPRITKKPGFCGGYQS